MLTRLAFLTARALAASTVSARSPDLPTGKWLVNVNSTKGELVINEIGKDGKVKGTLLGDAIEGQWDGSSLRFQISKNKDEVWYESCLISEPVEGGQIRYTLTGFRVVPLKLPGEAPIGGLWQKTGWFAQQTVKAPPGRIKAEIKGSIVYKGGASAYVSVKQNNAFGAEEETRVYFWLTEGEWKLWRDVMPKLDGQNVTITGAVSQLPKGSQTSIPESALYFLRGFEIKTATETFKD